MIQCVKHLSEDLVEHMATALIKQNHPNTYTITKNMAETIVAQNSNQIPVGILRPSIGKMANRKYIINLLKMKY